MRIWSLHPKYLDSKGLVALWRETLLAQYVLEGKTKGYKNHPQLDRFKKSKYPVDAINYYLGFIYAEAKDRGYNFSAEKFDAKAKKVKLAVTDGQMKYEAGHLLKKLKTRDPALYKKIKALDSFEPHPMFKVKEGEIEEWEIIINP
jgi:hypothetical protein